MKKFWKWIKSALRSFKNASTWLYTIVNSLLKKIWVGIKKGFKWLISIIRDLFQKGWKILLFLFLWLLACFTIYLQTLQIGDKIQAWAIITLVFITLFYAIQTQRLVKQENRTLEMDRKFRQSSFYERVLIDVFHPLKANIFFIKASVEAQEGTIENIKNTFTQITFHRSKYSHVINPEISELIGNYTGLEKALREIIHFDQLEPEWIQNLSDKTDELIRRLDRQALFLTMRINEAHEILPTPPE